MGAEHLPAPGAKINLLRLLGVDCYAERGAFGRSSLVEPLPGIAQVGGPQYSTLLTAEVHADAGINGVRVAGVNHDPAGVLYVGEILEVQVLPGLSAVGAAPHTGAVGDEHIAGIRGSDCHSVEVHQVNVAVKLPVDNLPGLAAVGAAGGAPHFQRRVHVIRVGSFYADAQNPRGESHLHRIRVGDGRHIIPILTAVLAPVDFAAFGAKKHDAGVGRGELDRPNNPAFRQIHSLPVVAPVNAAVHTPLGAGENRGRVLGMDGDCPDLGGRRQAPSQMFPAVGAGLFAVQPVRFGSYVDQCLGHNSASIELVF